MTAPLITVDGDTPRARRSDPAQSHAAADLSSYTRRKVLLAVLEVIREDGEMTGSEVNAAYRSWQVVSPGFPRCHPDSPRKRCSDAAGDSLLDVVGHKKSHYGTEEAIYRLSPEGRALLEAVGR